MRLPNLLRTVCAGTLAISLCSCATIVTTPVQWVRVTSWPTGADVLVNGEIRGTTPVTVTLARWGGYRIRIEMDGYQPYEIAMHKGMNGWFFGNIAIGGLVGMVVDTCTGAIWKIHPTQVHASLIRAGQTRDQDFTRIRDAEGNEVVFLCAQGSQPGWQKVGQLEKLKDQES